MVKRAHIEKKKLSRLIGKSRMCCDTKIRTVASIDAYGMATMNDGQTFHIYYCTEPVRNCGH